MSWLRSFLGLSSRGPASGASVDGAGHADNRCYDRLPSGFKFRISWRDAGGKNRKATARVVDMNCTGARVRCPVAIDPGVFVYIQTRGIARMGSAYIRRCESLTFSYELGLQFVAPLTVRF